MRHLLDYELLSELKRGYVRQSELSSTSQSSGADWDNTAYMYNEMTKMEKNSTTYALSLLPITSKDTVLDIGCGPGRVSIPLAKMAKRVTSLDVFGKMLEVAKQNSKEAGVKNINFIKKSWLDSDVAQVVGKHDIAFASRSVGLGDIDKLHKIAKKYVVLMCFFERSLRAIAQDLRAGIRENPPPPPLSPKEREFERAFSYNVTFNRIYDMGANPSVHIITDVYEKNFASREEAYKFFRFLGEIPKNKEKAYRANIDKYVFKIKDGFRFEQKARSYLMWWDTREIKKHKDK